MTDDSFYTLGGTGEAETRVRGSRFIAVAFPAEDEAGAREVLDERARRFHDATHHCAAWRFRDGGWRAIDAGEPSGSAGAPILAAISGLDLVDTAVGVTRYFGGTKLGVGGLARAYAEAAVAALAAAPRRRGIHAARVTIRYGYDDTSAVMRTLERAAAVDIEHGYTPDAAIVSFTIPSADLNALATSLREGSGGRIRHQVEHATVLYA